MFNAANTEHFAFYSKLRPFLAEVRAATKYPDYLESLEKVATAGPNSDDRLGIFQRYMERQKAIAAEGKQRPNLTA